MKNFFIIALLSLSFLFSESVVGKYQIATTSVQTKKGVYIVETIINTETGAVVKRKKIKLSSYKLPKKDRYNKIIMEEKLN